MLNGLLGSLRAERKHTALLEDSLWNCELSPCVAHMYGGAKEQGRYAAAPLALLAKRPAVEAPHVEALEVPPAPLPDVVKTLQSIGRRSAL